MKSLKPERVVRFLTVIGLATGLHAGADPLLEDRARLVSGEPAVYGPLLEGRVRLPSGQPVAGAQVRLFDLEGLHRVAEAATDESGWFSLTAQASTPALPERFHLGQNYPNPFNPSTVIPYELPAAARVRLEVFNLLGQRVAALVDEERPAGSFTAQWDGTDSAGRAVGAGVYLYRLQGGGMRATRRMLLIDGQAGIPSSEASSGGIPEKGREGVEAVAPVLGLTVSGTGLITHVNPAFRVEAGGGPVDLVVEKAGHPRGKVAASGVPGDVDNNGRVDVVDALLVALYILDSSLILPNNGDISRGDVNSDGRIDATDLWLILTNHVLPGPAPSGKMYWTAEGPPRIQRADLDGSNVEDLVTTGLVNPRGLALDAAGGKMYWLDRGTGKLQRADLDGSNVEDLLTSEPSAPLGLALDSPVISLTPDPSSVAFSRDGTKHRFTVQASEPIDVVANPAGTAPRMLVAESSSSFNECPGESEDRMTRLHGQTVYLAGCEPGQATVELRRASDQEVLRSYTFKVSEAVKIYWTDAYSKKIQRADLDGSNVEDLVTGLNEPIGLALDAMGRKMYWTDKGTDKIHRANLDGSQVEDLVAGLREPRRVALDPAGGKMYWADATTDKIQRANLDGTDIEDLVTGLVEPRGLALDIPGGRMYWTDRSANRIQRANLDGTRIEDLLTGLREPVGLALDLAGRKIYWADSTTDRIHRANLDGSRVEDVLTTGLREPRGLALDIAGGRLYWADNGADGIFSASLDGTHVKKLHSAVTPIGIALDIGDSHRTR